METQLGGVSQTGVHVLPFACCKVALAVAHVYGSF